VRRREPVVTDAEPMPAHLAVFTESDWPKPKRGSPLDLLAREDGEYNASLIRSIRKLAWERARRDWRDDRDPEYQAFKANGYNRRGL
jgi:hypothetical protein